MTATLRLIQIEAKRNPAIWLVPVIILVSWWLLGLQSWADFLWLSTNDLIQRVTVPFAAPAMAGAAAWVAGRDGRRGVNDLLQTTPTSMLRRKAVLCVATSFWGLLAYGMIAVWMAGTTARLATVGTLEMRPIGIAVAAILAHTAWGILVGTILPSRFTAPVVAIAALGIQQYFASQSISMSNHGSMSMWMNHLAAHNDGWNWWPAALYVALALTAFAGLMVYQSRNLPNIATLATSMLLVAGSVIMIWGTYPAFQGEYEESLRNNFGWKIAIPTYEPPVYVCEGSPVEVCVQKIYEPILGRIIPGANAVAAPLVGIPGVPLTLDDQHLGYYSGPGRQFGVVFTSFAGKLVADDSTLVDWNPANEAQLAIREWLLMQADEESSCGYIFHYDNSMMSFNTGDPTEESCAASERFRALPEAEQRAWLEANYSDLRLGKLTLADLP